ncbi:MAG: tetratricopeptide repeat protein [Verrucomicrobiota bacterium]
MKSFQKLSILSLAKKLVTFGRMKTGRIGGMGCVCLTAWVLIGCGSKEEKTDSRVSLQSAPVQQKTVEKKSEPTLARASSAKSLLTVSPWNLLLLLADRLDPSSRENALCDVAVLMAQLGDVQQALNLTEKMDSFQKVQSLCAVFKALIQVKDLRKAVSVTNQLDDASKQKAFYEIAVAMAQAGNVQQALIFAEQLGGKDKANALYAIAKASIQTGDVQQALNLLPQAMAAAVSQTTHEIDKVHTLRSSAEVLSRAGEKKRALELLSQALALSGKMTGKERFDAQSSLAFAIAEAGDLPQAIYIANQMDEKGRAWSMSQIALIVAQEGKIPIAISVANQLQGGYKVATLHKIALIVAKSGDRQMALQLLTQAVAMIDQVGDLYKTDMLIDTASAIARAGNLQQALTIANRFKGKERIWALKEIAKALAEAGERSRGLHILSQALEEPVLVDSKNSSSLGRAYELYEIAQTLVKIDLSPGSQTFTAEGRKIAENILSKVVEDQYAIR